MPKIRSDFSKYENQPVSCYDQEDCLSHCLFNGMESGNCKDKICICIPYLKIELIK